MKRNNGGFTMVELLVSISILAIVSAAAFVMIESGSRLYGRVSSSVDISVAAQTAMEQTANYVIDCDGGICYSASEGRLDVLNANGSGGYTRHSFIYDAQAGEINYSRYESGSVEPAEQGLLAGSVSGFSVELDEAEGRATAASITIELTMDGRRHSETRTVALRNNPVTASSPDELPGKLGGG